MMAPFSPTHSNAFTLWLSRVCVEKVFCFVFKIKIITFFFCTNWWMMSRLWHIFWYQHHPQQPHGWTIGNRIGGKTSSQRWPLFQLQWLSSLLLPLPLAHSSLVTSSVPAPPSEVNLLHFSFLVWPNAFNSRYCWCPVIFHSTRQTHFCIYTASVYLQSCEYGEGGEAEFPFLFPFKCTFKGVMFFHKILVMSHSFCPN